VFAHEDAVIDIPICWGVRRRRAKTSFVTLSELKLKLSRNQSRWTTLKLGLEQAAESHQMRPGWYIDEENCICQFQNKPLTIFSNAKTPTNHQTVCFKSLTPHFQLFSRRHGSIIVLFPFLAFWCNYSKSERLMFLFLVSESARTENRGKWARISP